MTTPRTFDQLTPDEQWTVVTHVRDWAFEDGLVFNPDETEWTLDPEAAPEDQHAQIIEQVSKWPADWIGGALIGQPSIGDA